jgi:4-carboxymuconolactone decarboxylase
MTDNNERLDKGTALANRLFEGVVRTESVPMPAELRRYTMEHVFGDVWQGKDLSLEERSLMTCTILVATGRENEQRLHFQGAKNLGIPRKKVEAMITHVAHYAGWPVAVSANAVLEEVWPHNA